MNYKFQKFTTVYQEFIDQFIEDNPNYENLTYKELYNKFTNTQYGTSNFYEKHMKSLGNEAQDLFASFEPLQKAWARENNIKYKKNTWLKDIVLAQIKFFQPDVLYLQDLYLFNKEFRQELRSVCKNEVIVIGWRAAPTNDFSAFNDIDIILSSAPHFIEKLKQNGAKAVYMPLAFEHTILDLYDSNRKRDLDFTFAGSLINQKGWHSQRYNVIEKLLESTPLQIWTNLYEPKITKISRNIKYQINKFLFNMGIVDSGKTQKLTSLKKTYPKQVHESVFGINYYEILARSKIVINCHIDAANNYGCNARVYEATGMGACLLTDWKSNLSKFFKLDTEIVTYNSLEECIQKAFYLLEHENERIEISKLGQIRTLKNYTYHNIIQQCDKLIRNLLE